MPELTDDDIASQYSTARPEGIAQSPQSDDDIANMYSTATPQSAAEVAAERTRKSIKHTESGTLGNIVRAIPTGIVDFGVSGLNAINLVAGTEEEKQKYKDYMAARNKKFEESAGPGSDIGRFAGQVLATAPFAITKPFQAAFRALPTINTLGETVAPPLINKLASSVAQGATSGAAFGAGTSSTNDEGLAANVGKGTILGAIAGPVGAAAGYAGNKTIDAAKDIWKHVNTDALARLNGIDTNAAIKIVQKLEAAGYTPQTAQIALNKMGPKATIADLDESMVSDVRALAQSGGKPTSILKGRYEARAEGANNETKDLMTNVLGPKPDIEAEKEAVKKQAFAVASPDYKIAHANTTPLDVSPVVSDIDARLKNAVGKEASVLKEAKGYLFDDVGKVKTGVLPLHSVRQGLDDMLDRLPEEGTSAQSHTYRAVEKVRNAVDKQLKTIPEMKAADEKFAAKMKEKEGLQYGYDAFKKVNNIESFKKEFDAATPEVQAAIKKGMHSQIGDMINKAQRGEFAGAQQLLGKRSLNRQMVKHALGYSGDVVLEGLQNEAALRGTEKGALTGSHTAGNQMIQADWGLRPTGGSAFGEAAKALPFDLIGGGGAAAGVSFVRKAGQNALLKFSENRVLRTAEAGADLLSKSGAARDTALGILNRVSAIQGKLRNPSVLRLPVSFSGPAGEETYKEYNNKR